MYEYVHSTLPANGVQMGPAETTWRCWEGFAPVPSTTCQTACFLNRDLTTHRPFRSDMANGSSPAAPHFFCLDMSCNKLTT